MKKICTILCIAVLSFVLIAPANAQLRYGIKGGLNLANNDVSDLVVNGVKNTVNAENMTGFYIGPTAEFTVPIIGIGMDASFLYSMKGGKYEIRSSDIGATLKDKVHYFEIPLNLKYKYSFLVAGVYVTFGPYISYAFAGKRSVSDVITGNSGDFKTKDFYKEFDYGLNLGGGVEILNHLQVGVQYSWGLNDAAKNKVFKDDYLGAASSFKAKNRVFSVNLTLLF